METEHMTPDKKFFIDFKYEGDLNEDENPYKYVDGNKWGSWGSQQLWFRVDKENPHNVFELEETKDYSENLTDEWTVKSRYFRVWDCSIKKWRDLNDREKSLFTIPDRREKLKVFNNEYIQIPIIKNSADYKLDLRDVMMCNPMKDE